ncbi:SusC/RagA family TonB-linked outer membrane protein [Niastella sp. OAS944]|uniref:SusC/RagA family TonB-linked outer membrane protein n=1 Tax=Niastella sp. OAS944 TaxID=2664089 RepID=UPI0035C7BA6C|nr:TonB-linked SusC/RagA family outer membrane protein [Chitinophagaceae bacterium OAS944]
MKLVVVILLAGCLQVQATGYGQNVTIALKDAPLEKLFKEIKKQTNYKFLYVDRLVRNAKRITVDVKNASVEDVLHQCLKEQSLGYEIKEKLIVIVPKANPQNSIERKLPSSNIKDVRGIVTDENGVPTQGVNIVVRGTSKGTTTNAKGEFYLKDLDENAVLIITSVGYNRQEVSIKSNDYITLKLSVAVGNLDELQVIAYGTTSKRFNTGNVITIKSTEIVRQPVQNPLLALQGRVPGLEVTQMTGLNGGAVTARVQGRNSFRSAALDPLIVIDGVPYPSVLSYSGIEGGSILDGLPVSGAGGFLQGGSPLNYINPNDIESIDILKDADATAIYGSRAGNGAILITTKRGKEGKTKINVSLQQGWAKVERKVSMMNTRQYLDMRYEAYMNDGVDISTLRPRGSNYDVTLWDTTRYTDWQKTLIGGTAQYSDVSANISGGSSTMQYLVSGTYSRQTTVFPGSFDDKKGGLHFNVNGQSTNQKLKLQLSGNYVYDRNILPPIDLTEQSILLAPNSPYLYNSDGTLNWEPNAAGNSSWVNPLSYIYAQEFTNITKNLVGNMSIGYKLMPGLEIKSSFGYNNINSILYKANRLESFRPERRATSQRFANFSTRNMNSWIIEPQLQYSGSFGNSKLEVLLGSTHQRNNNDVLTQGASGFTNDLLMKSLAAATSSFVIESSANTYKYVAFFGRLNYNWNSKYLINLTGRRDGSSRFGDNNKFHNFGSIGLGWIFSEEHWAKKHMPFLSFGKIRGSFGTTGNDQIADYSYLSLYYVNSLQIPYQNSSSIVVDQISNPNLQWEETRKLLIGIDVGILNDRILLNANFAHNRSSNQLINYKLPTVTGFNAINDNFGATIQNTSWEFMLTTTNVKGKVIQWTSILNLTIPKNKLVSFPNIDQTPYGQKSSNFMVGQPLGITKADQHYIGVDPATGFYQVADSSGLPIPVTDYPNYPKDYFNIIVNTNAQLYGGFQNTISYKAFQLDFLFQFIRRRGPKQLYYSNGNYRPPGTFSWDAANQPVTLVNRHWQKPGDQAEFARYNSDETLLVYPPFTDIGYSFDASYIRLKNVSLSWQIPSRWRHKAHLENAQVYFRSQNLITITKFTGLDPETQNITSLPPLTVWTIGVKLEL